ncbi:uncharacterized protein LOC126734316 [Anthonomus grandis grandis]|uniref:uncharacterized protein LOC126734316 n=1 Tax=Anthonomus grandis grandis TaxID=2921223 RepID=UPI002165C7B0|nr:uncharacterized protein LOC126734316 [Anthonomus grandis grandis]
MLPQPSEDMWKTVADTFNTIWNFPNCLGAIDGKHFTIQAPPNSGSQFFNYKKTFFIVLLALVDAHYNFVAVDVGAYSKNSDGGIFAKCNLGKALQNNSLSVPQHAPLPRTDMEAPYVVVGDEAFPLKNYFMRPYPGRELHNSKRVFNYCLSRARRTVENAFGILIQKFRIFTRRIQAKPENVDYIILAACILHNFIKKYDTNTYNYPNANFNNVPQQQVHQNLPMQGGNATADAFQARELFTEYFSSEIGCVPWQDEKV